MPTRNWTFLPRPGFGPADQLSGYAEMPLAQFLDRMLTLLHSIPEDSRARAVIAGLSGLRVTCDVTISDSQAANERVAYLEHLVAELAGGKTLDRDELLAAIRHSQGLA